MTIPNLKLTNLKIIAKRCLNFTFFSRKRKAGFTLLEIVVSIGIFAVISLLISGSFLALNSARKTSRNAQEILNELRFSIDLIGVEITSGSAFPDGCENGCGYIVFGSRVRPDMPLRRIEYYLDGATKTIMKSDQKTYGVCSHYYTDDPTAIGAFDPECYQPYTSDKARIDLLKFFVNNKGDDKQVIVSVAMQGIILPGTKEEKSFEISNSYSPRLLQDPAAMPPRDSDPPTIQITQPTDQDTYTTSASSLIIGGIASDNKGIDQIEWRNETNNSFGFANSLTGNFATWDTPAIPLVGGTANVLVATAKDTAGNLANDVLTINSTAPPPSPDIAGSSSCGNKIKISWEEIIGVNDYHFYRCPGDVDCTTPYDFFDNNGNPTKRNSSQTPGKIYYWADEGLPTDAQYTYRIRGHNHTTGSYTPYSDKIVETVSNLPCSAGGGSFELSASPITIQVIVSGGTTDLRTSESTIITVSPSGSFSGNVALSVFSGGPTGMTHNFTPSSLSSPYGTGSEFKVKVPNNTTTGSYPIVIKGQSPPPGAKSAKVNITLYVKAGGGGGK